MEKDNSNVSSCEPAAKCVMILWKEPVSFCLCPASAVRDCEGWGLQNFHLCNVITYTNIKNRIEKVVFFSLKLFLTF